MKKFLSFLFWIRGAFFILEILKIVVIALLIVIPVRYFLFQPFIVWGQSMEPSFGSGDYLIVDEISYRFQEPQRGEVVVFRYPQMPSSRYIKRIIGLPGEKIEIKEGKIMIYKNGDSFFLDESNYLSPFVETSPKKWPFISERLRDNEYFVLGDNRSSSSDSRVWGLLPRENIIGRVFLRAWPPSVLAKIETPNY